MCSSHEDSSSSEAPVSVLGSEPRPFVEENVTVILSVKR